MSDELRERIFKTISDSPAWELYEHERWQIVDAIIGDLGLKAKYAGRLGVSDRWHAVGDTWIEAD